jgi:hypothetical protein
MQKDVMNIERKKIAILLTALAVASIMSGIALAAFAANNGEESSNGSAGLVDEGIMTGRCGWPRGWMRGQGCFGFVEVSEEFKENVTNIAQSDTDVQNLLNDGYNITEVRPIIRTIVAADGTLETKATSAIIVLEKGTTSHATAWVDLQEGKVTEIVIVTRTVIDKS